MSTHTLSVLVENSPGVLARVAGLFSRRAYNIDSLAVGPTENPDISRMTIVINVESHSLEQVIRQLDKLVNVIHIAELKLAESVQAELLLVKISATSKNRFDVDAVLEQAVADGGAGRSLDDATVGAELDVGQDDDLGHGYWIRGIQSSSSSTLWPASTERMLLSMRRAAKASVTCDKRLVCCSMA